MMIKYVNAGITSKAELATRLIAGEVFYFGETRNKVHFNALKTPPFRCGDTYVAWDGFAEMYIEQETHWYDDIPEEGIPCRVYAKEYIRLIVAYDDKDRLFEDIEGSYWTNAEPIKPEECYKENI